MAIKTVKGLRVGDLFFHEGNLFEVDSFPTRSMVVGELLKELLPDSPGMVNIPVREVNLEYSEQIKRMSLLTWAEKNENL